MGMGMGMGKGKLEVMFDCLRFFRFSSSFFVYYILCFFANGKWYIWKGNGKRDGRKRALLLLFFAFLLFSLYILSIYFWLLNFEFLNYPCLYFDLLILLSILSFYFLCFLPNLYLSSSSSFLFVTYLLVLPL